MSCECSICRGPMVLCPNNEIHETISATGCGHTFHSLCLQEWLAISMSCPKCCLAVEYSSGIKKLYFDAFTTDQRTPTIIDAQLYSLKRKIIERDAEIDYLKKSIAASNRECELAKFQRMLMKTKVNKSNLEMMEIVSDFNSVARYAFKEASIWRKVTVSRGMQMGAMDNRDAIWESLTAKIAMGITRLEQSTAQVEPEITFNPWGMLKIMMSTTIEYIIHRLNQVENFRMWLLDDLVKGEAILKTTIDLHLAEMEQAKQLQQMTQREIDNLKAEIKSELKTRDTPNAKIPTMMSRENVANFQSLPNLNML